MMTTLTIKTTLIYDPKKGETKEGALAGVLRAMADGIEDDQRQGGAPNGGHWVLTWHGPEKK